MKLKGYTLIEMVVVLFLLGILAAIAVPSWLAFSQRQQIRTATTQLKSALRSAKSEASKNSVRYAVTVCADMLGSQEFDGIKYSIHPYAERPTQFTAIENVSLVSSTVRRSPTDYNLLLASDGDCYTAYLGLFPGDGYALGFFYLSNRHRQDVYRVGFNTLIGNVSSCPVVSLEKLECK